eukprot:TRINITY_DN13002_c0_g1_i1.p2 TRINITY_DN13002_c0_g1~~TRINITY_DN13002_c0_g1_i1.p2  ORF type:complete len:523 (+),score=144.50 TRINITY_DN13002_c0_g1_i1:173-1570(+)
MVGYLEAPPNEKGRLLMTRRMFPSKVGGKPAWLIPRDLPSPAPAATEGAAATPAVASTDAAGAPPAATAAAADLACKCCGRPLRFLLQVYASRGYQRREAFHRVLHFFICTNCQPNEVRVFRAQLPRENDFYSSEAPDADRVVASLRRSGGRDADLDRCCCAQCGLPHGSADAGAAAEGGGYSGGGGRGAGSRKGGRGSKSSAAANAAIVCGECARRARGGDGPAVFQERDMSTMEADVPDEDDAPAETGAGAAAGASSGAAAGAEAEAEGDVEEVLTPAVAKERGATRESLIDEADAVIAAAKAKGASDAVLDKLRDYRAKVAESADNVIDGSEQAVFDEWCKQNGEHDVHFSRFNRFAAANPGHMLRYSFAGEPLWFCGPGRPEAGPPKCENCGADRVFECQVQPQLISLLAGTPLADRLDYGVICCFVCSESCCASSERSSPYLEEVAVVQGEPQEAWLPRG